MSRIVLGVSGGIAAYSVRAVASAARCRHEVTVVPTVAALEFVGVSTWAALSGPASAHLGVRRRPSGAARQDRAGGRPGLRCACDR